MFEFKIDEHPARAKVHGKEVPMFRGVHKAVWVKDETVGRFVLCAYCGANPGQPISLIRSGYPQSFVDELTKFVDANVGQPSVIASPTEVVDNPGEDDE